MKAKALRIGKAMSAALFVLLLVAVGSKNALAQTQVATLQHGDDINVFYGMNAFVEAHSAAANGDVVTLSSGTFTGTNITKAITIRGAGYAADTLLGTLPTMIPGTFTMNANNDSTFLTMEGIYFSGTAKYGDLKSPKFVRCAFNNFSYSNTNCYMRDAQFVNCIILRTSGDSNNFNYTYRTTFINCVVQKYQNNNTSSIAYNSIIYLGSMNNNGLSAYNSIIANDCNYLNGPMLAGSSVAYNCIGIQLNSYSPFSSSIPTFNCATYNSYEEVFDTFEGTFTLDEAYLLKNEIATGFLGNDGTQVGIHGGLMPYNPRPTYMILNRCHVAGRSTIDGKLSVDIEVITEDE